MTPIGLRMSRMVERWCDYPNFIWTWHRKPCWHCGRKTSWVELSFECALHPGFCEAQKDAEYSNALRHGDLLKLISDIHTVMSNESEIPDVMSEPLTRAEMMLKASNWPVERKTDDGAV